MSVSAESAEIAGDAIAGAQRFPAAIASLFALLSVRPLLGMPAGDFALVASVILASSVAGRWTGPWLSWLGDIAVGIRAHAVVWGVLAFVGLVVAFGVVLGSDPGELRPGVSVLVLALLLSTLGLWGRTSYRIHALVSFLVVFVGLGWGGNSRYLWWAGYASSMMVAGVLAEHQRHATRFAFGKLTAVPLALKIGMATAVVYLGLFGLACAIAPSSERTVEWRVDPKAMSADPLDDLSPWRLVLALAALVALALVVNHLLERFRKRIRRASGDDGELRVVASALRRDTAREPRAHRRDPVTDRERIAQLYEAWCQRLEKSGHRRSEWMTPDEFARKIVSRRPESQDVVESLTGLVQEACYSTRSIGQPEVARMRELCQWSIVNDP